MSDYTGKTCPYCKTKFALEDDIIVCSECEMPHHKDCWVENQGCTTFGCLGTIHTADAAASSVTNTQMNYEDSQPTVADDEVFCIRCGTRSVGDAVFCTHCGNRLIRDTPPPAVPQPETVYSNAVSDVAQQSANYQTQNTGYQSQNTTPNMAPGTGYQTQNTAQGSEYQAADVDWDVRRLVGTNSEYYLPQFQVMKSQNKSDTWNWPAFLVAPYWMIYRKMYSYGAVLLAAEFLISLMGSGYLSLLAFCGYIVFGFLGNSIYMKHIDNRANQVKTMQEPHKSQFITVNGDVNVMATAIAVIGRILLAAIAAS